jgi:hypothetical protein
MALKLRLVNGDIFDGHSPLAGLVLNHPIHQSEGVAVGQQSLDLLRGENHLPAGYR